MTGAAERDLVGVVPVGVVASAAAGDDVAFARIVDAYHDDMSRVCSFITRSDALAEDAVQTAWSVAWRKLGSLRDPERLRPWLMRIAVNEAKRLLRQRRRRSEVEATTDPPQVVGWVDPATGIDSIDVLDAVERLDPDDRALLVLRYVLGYDATELADAIGLSPPGTRARLQRLLQRIRRDLE